MNALRFLLGALAATGAFLVFGFGVAMLELPEGLEAIVLILLLLTVSFAVLKTFNVPHPR